MIVAPLPHVVRPAGSPDLAFVGKSWVEGVAHADPFCGCDRHWIEAAARALAARLMRLSVALVACSTEDERQLFGCLVGSPSRREMHWIYTKATPDFRRLGIATSLMREMFGGFEEVIRYSVRTSAIPHYHDRWNLVFDSSILRKARWDIG
jgi:hypothetical protein